MIKTVIATLAGTLIAAASPAATRADVSSAASAPAALAPAASADTPVPAKAAKAKRYCVQNTITGSRLPQRTCQTRDEWLAQGFDPLKK